MGRGGRGAIDPRVQQRTYLFTDTGEQLPYAVFVSSKVSKDKKNPLIVALHGLGGDQNTMLRGNALQLAEEGGYIMVGPMGYNSGGWYGTPARYNGGGGRRGAPPAGAPAAGAPPAGAPQAPPAGRAAGPAPGAPLGVTVFARTALVADALTKGSLFADETTGLRLLQRFRARAVTQIAPGGRN